MGTERGRPRTFDVEDALDQATAVFWRHGFLNASLAELTEAMGLNKPSLYAAFGDKESLYLKALDRYISKRISEHAALLDSGVNGRVAVETFLRALAAMYTDPSLPGGCFIVNAASSGGSGLMPEAVESALGGALQANEARLRSTLTRAQKEGVLAESASPKSMATFFMSVVMGMGMLATNGAKSNKLSGIIDVAMQSWPTDAPKPAGRKSTAA